MASRRAHRRGHFRLGVESLESRLTLSVSIDFDYTYDNLGFFAANPSAKTVLQQAGAILGSQLNDNLAAIVPVAGSGNTWSEEFTNPSLGTPVSVLNPTVPANTIVVYVAGRIPTNSFAGEGGPGGFSSLGSSEWNTLVSTRNATGMGRLWGGTISFSTQTPWSFAGISAVPESNQYDFLTIALHELGHVLGIGTSDEWRSQANTTNDTFSGSHSQAMYGGPVPLNTAGQYGEAADGHWGDGLLSFGLEPVVDVTPLASGQRKPFTSLDWAGLQDLGWHVDHLTFTSQPPTTARSGTPFSLTASVLDPDGHVDTSFNGPVTIAIGNNPGNATLSGILQVNAQNGIARFSSLILDNAGVNYTLVASADRVAPATTNPLTIGASTDLGVLAYTSRIPSSVTAGATFGFTVVVQNSSGQTVSQFNEPVTASLTNGFAGSALSGALTVNAVSGVAKFSGLSITKAGTGYQIQVSAGSVTSRLSSTFNVNPGAASKLRFTSQPHSPVSAGNSFALEVQITDVYGNPRSDRTDLIAISLESNPSGEVLGGITSTNASNGIASFSRLVLGKAASGITIDAKTVGLTTAQTSSFEVVPSAPKVVGLISQPPASLNTGTGFGFVAEVRDANGNLTNNFNGTATVSLVANPGGSTLSGPLTVNVVGGHAVFSGLILNYPGADYRLQVTLNTGASGFSNTFNVSGEPGNGGPSQALSIVRVAILWAGTGKRRRLIGFELDFNRPIEASRALNTANYTIVEMVKKGRKTVTRQVGVRPGFGISSSVVRLTLVGNHPFKLGGSLTARSSYPSGIIGTNGNFLTARDAVFTVLKHAKGIQ